jgi:ComF family protein
VGLLDILIPPACAGCGRYGVALCASCIGTFRPPSRDEDRFAAPDSGAVVGECLTLAISAFAYDGRLRRALGALKYAGARNAAAPVATAALPAFRRLLRISGPVPVVPVPLHPERQRERGYNQATLLGDALAARSGASVTCALVRTAATTRQHELDRAARLRNLASAFEPADFGRRAPTAAILVDDILTTSATMEACAAVLRRAGAAEVYGFTIAREV